MYQYFMKLIAHFISQHWIVKVNLGKAGDGA
jgi:hypothetical protein